jgi:hypothetical protein
VFLYIDVIYIKVYIITKMELVKIFDPSNELLILSVNFCNVVKCGIRNNRRNNLR